MSDKNLYRPSPAQFSALAAKHNLIPVVREYAADLDTPVSVYLKLMAEDRPSFLLESVQKGEMLGRYSFVGLNPHKTVVLAKNQVTVMQTGTADTCFDLAAGEDVLHTLKAELETFDPAEIGGLPRFIGGAVGYLSYDTVRYYEQLPDTAADVLDIPDAIFFLADTLVVFDHVQHKLLIMSNARVGDDVSAAYDAAVGRIETVAAQLNKPLTHIPHTRPITGDIDRSLQSNKTQAQYEEMVRVGKEHIAAGDAFQIVLSQRLTRQTDAHPFAIYRALRMLNPSPYMFYFNFPSHDFQVVGASPEVLVRLEDGVAAVRPIAGTRPRGRTPSEDMEMETDLLNDPKEVAEHVMLIDLGRNDIGRVSKYGTVEVSDLMVIEKYSHVMHIVSHVEGELRDGMDQFDLMRATFPAGTLSGAPKVRAMEIIETLEGERRGLYGGAVGYFGYDGSMDMCIAIRTMLMKGNQLYVQAGAGVVADSDPTKEYEECWNKARAVVVAVERAEQSNL